MSGHTHDLSLGGDSDKPRDPVFVSPRPKMYVFLHAPQCKNDEL